MVVVIISRMFFVDFILKKFWIMLDIGLFLNYVNNWLIKECFRV